MLRRAFEAALSAVEPATCVTSHLEKKNGEILVLKESGETIDVTPGPGGSLAMISTGKAAHAMMKGASEVIDISGPRLIITNEPAVSRNARVITASHPVPDEGSLLGGKQVLKVVSSLTPQDSLIFLLSGGSSSMMAQPEEGISLSDKVLVQKELMRRGADIFELNAVRKCLSKIKGGKLARNLKTRKSAVLVLSDVPGNDLSTVGSGPLFPSSGVTSPLEVLDKYGLTEELPARVVELAGMESSVEDKPRYFPPHVIVGDNRKAVSAAARFLEGLGFTTIVLEEPLEGEARETGKKLAEKLLSLADNRPADRLAVVAGGETVVTVRGKGTGGRNQELALSAALAIEGARGIYGLCAGTDGRDGNSPAAGGFFDGELADRARNLNLDPISFLEKNDSHTILKKLGYVLTTGKTGTNVMDVFIAIIEGP